RPVAAYICPENFKQGGLANVLLRLRRSVHQSAQSLAARLQPGGTSSPSEPSGGEPGAQGHPVGTQASVHARRRTGRFLPRLSPGFFPFCMRTGPLPSSAEKNRLDLLLFNGSVPDPDPVSPGRGPGSDGSVQPPVDEVKGRPVLDSVTVLQPPLQKQPVTSRTIPRFLIVIMGTTAPGQPPQPRQGRQPTGGAIA